MKRIILHIGTEKTGTSTTQSFFHKNANKLRDHGILYPKTLYGADAPSHIGLAVYAKERKNGVGDMHGKVGISDVSEIAPFREVLKAKLYAEANAHDFNVMVLSSEHLTSRLTLPLELDRLKTLLEPLGRVEIVLYLRPQEELLASSYSTNVRLGSTDKFSEYIQKAMYADYYNYKALCNLWAGVFGKENVRVRIFSKASFQEGDLLADFIQTAGLPIDLQNYVRPPNENASLGLLHLEFIRQLNFYLPHMGPATNYQADPRQGDLLPIMDRLNAAEKAKPKLPAAAALSIRELFAEGNAYVARAFFGREDGRLFTLRALPPEEVAQKSFDPELPLTKAFEIFAQVWERSVART